MLSHYTPLFRSVASAFARSCRKRPIRKRLTVEALEDRLTPAALAPLASAADNDPGSLRDAIITANGNGEDDVITLQSGTYQLSLRNEAGKQENAATEGDLDLTEAGRTITFQGAGPDQTFINAGQIDRAFQVFGNVTAVFRNLTITRGLGQDDGTLIFVTDARGGGILNEGGNVTLDNVHLAFNEVRGSFNGADGGTAQGAEVFSSGGSLTLINSTLQRNTAFGGAGPDGIPVIPSLGGRRGGYAAGGGIFATGTTLTLTNPAFLGNSAAAGPGGSGTTNSLPAIFGIAPGGNGGDGGLAQGGGLLVSNSTVTITGALFSGNTVLGGGGGAGGAGNADETVTGGDGGLGGSAGVAEGGGVFVDGGTVTLSRSTLSDNNVRGGEGGRGGDGGFSQARVGDGGANGGLGGVGGYAAGGGVYVGSGTVTVSSSTLSANTSVGGNGGAGGTGGESQGRGGAGGNGALGGDSQGGGILAAESTLLLSNSTLSGNKVVGSFGGRGGNGGLPRDGGGVVTGHGGRGGDGGLSQGGGLHVARRVTANLHNSTIAFNVALASNGGNGGDSKDRREGGTGQPGQGGGVRTAGGTINLVSTIIANNSTVGAGTEVDFSGDVTTATNSLLTNNAGSNLAAANPDANGNKVGKVDAFGPSLFPLLAVLTDNGGPTQTHALLAGSPAIDAGVNPDGLTVDQRGLTRNAGGRVDMGAVEVADDAVPPPPAPPRPVAAPPVAVPVVVAPVLVPRVVQSKGKFSLQIVDDKGVVRLRRSFARKVRVLRSDVNGDGVLDLVAQFQQNGKIRRLAFDGLNLAPLPS